MNDKIRKRIWPVSLIAILGVIAMLAVVWSSDSVPVQAQSPPPVWFIGDDLAATEQSDTQINLSWNAASGAASYKLERKTGSAAYSITGGVLTGATHNDMGLMASTTYTYRITAVNDSGETVGSEVMATTMAAGNGGNGNGGNGNGGTGAMLESSSTSGGASVKLTLTIVKLPEDLNSGSWVEIYLEDDYQEPGSISRQDVVFIATNAEGMGTPATNDGGTVIAADVEIDDGGEIDGEADAVVISARIPDMDPRDDSFGYPLQGQTLMMIVASSAGIKNPTEAKSNSTGYAIVDAGDDRGDVADMKLTDLLVKAKIGLSADDGGRGKEVTISGSGFNDDTIAEAFVLPVDSDMDGEVSDAEFWNALNCYEMNMAVGQMGEDMDDEGEGFCQMYDDLSAGEMAIVDDLDYTKDEAGAALCSAIVRSGESLGTAGVGDNHEFSIAFTVHQDEFDTGEVNYICAADNKSPSNRSASAVKVFDVTPSLTISPDSVSSGEEVTLKPRDFEDATAEEPLEVSLNGGTAFVPEADGSDYVFDMPGGLSGVVQISFKQGGDTKDGTITVDPSSLTLNQTEVAPNESIIISGSGFSDGTTISVADIEIDGKMLEVDDAGTEGNGVGRFVSITSSGQFTVTVNVWHDGAGNPALDADEYTIKVTDSNGYEGKTKITISEPTILVMPEVAGPRDYITISGANWPVSTSEDDYDVSIEVDGKTRSASIDRSGRFNYEYRLSGSIGIGKEHDVKVTFTSRHNDKIEEETTFAVPSSNVVITPAAAAPGQTIDLEISGMPIGELVSEVTIDGGNRLGGINLNTDRNGDVTITGIVVPYSEPGFYPVKIVVGTETAIVQLEILTEGTAAGVAAALPGALSEVGDNLVRVFHFNNSTKVWTFYDPRPEFEGLNTLTELANGQPYWILVSAAQENVVMNGKTRDLTCVGGDCWNQEVW